MWRWLAKSMPTFEKDNMAQPETGCFDVMSVTCTTSYSNYALRVKIWWQPSQLLTQNSWLLRQFFQQRRKINRLRTFNDDGRDSFNSTSDSGPMCVFFLLDNETNRLNYTKTWRICWEEENLMSHSWFWLELIRSNTCLTSGKSGKSLIFHMAICPKC